MSTEDYEDPYEYTYLRPLYDWDGDDFPDYVSDHYVTRRWRPIETVNLPEEDCA